MVHTKLHNTDSVRKFHRGPEDVFLYVIGRPQGPCKIGHSKNPEQRAADLQAGCHFRLQVLFKIAFPTRSIAFEKEQITHRAWWDRQLYGEWFDVTAEEAINVIRAGEE